MSEASIIPFERIAPGILYLRGERVILDADLAVLYGVPTKVLNQAVRRNPDRFPSDFMFELTEAEKQEVVTVCDHLRKLKFSPYLPHAFTEHGAIMAASVLNSDRAIRVSVEVTRAFVQVRRLLATHVTLSRKLAALEKKYDKQFRIVFDAIRALMEPPDEPKKKPIGFRPD